MNTFTKTFFITLLTIICASGVYSQKKASKPDLPPKPADSYWAAQRNIETAITQLEAFIKSASSDDKRVQSATDQIQMLKEIRIVPGKNPWSVLMNEFPYPYIPPIEWRIAAIDSQAERTGLNIEIRNTLTDGRQCFQTFDQNPLILIDNKGQSVPMIKVGKLPDGVKLGRTNTETRWCLEGNQAIFLNVDFAPLARGTTSGQINYSEYTKSVKPAVFSLFKQKLE